MRSILTFYLPPKVEKEPEIGWLCDFCGKGQDKEKEAFTKFRFQYCSMKCLSGHGYRSLMSTVYSSHETYHPNVLSVTA